MSSDAYFLQIQKLDIHLFEISLLLSLVNQSEKYLALEQHFSSNSFIHFPCRPPGRLQRWAPLGFRESRCAGPRTTRPGPTGLPLTPLEGRLTARGAPFRPSAQPLPARPQGPVSEGDRRSTSRTQLRPRNARSGLFLG